MKKPSILKVRKILYVIVEANDAEALWAYFSSGEK
jgi:hypothetical protein